MIPIKIECGCGQRYAFDVEPVEGRMPTEAACPACGADGTEAANAVIAQSLAPPPPVAAAPARVAPLRATVATPTAPRVTVAAPAPADGTQGAAAARFGKIDRAQAEHEAKAKMSWGDSPEDVARFLVMQGFSNEEATSLARSLFEERAKAIRANGVKKIVTGIGLMCVPVVTLVIFLSVKVLPMHFLGMAVAVGLWGAWRILKGTIMVISPKSEPGDVAEQ